MQNINCRINIPIVMGPTLWTRPFTNCERFGPTMVVTMTTDLTGIVGLDSNELFTIPVTLVSQHGTELMPTSVGNGRGKMMILLQILDFQIFNDNHIVLRDQCHRQLMQVIAPLISDSSLIASFLNSSSLPVLVVIQFLFDVLMVMVPLTGTHRGLMTAATILRLPMLRLLS